MSIHYAVASALLRGSVDEASYLKLDDPALLALAAVPAPEPGWPPMITIERPPTQQLLSSSSLSNLLTIRNNPW
jgi:hypothetical protein